MDVSAFATERPEGMRIARPERNRSSCIAPDLDRRDQALVALGRDLREAGYRFPTPTPPTEARAEAPATRRAPSARDECARECPVDTTSTIAPGYFRMEPPLRIAAFDANPADAPRRCGR